MTSRTSSLLRPLVTLGLAALALPTFAANRPQPVAPAAATAIARTWLANEAAAGRVAGSAADVAELATTDRYASDFNGLTHVWLRQSVDGREVVGSEYGVHVGPRGNVAYAAGSFVPGLAARAAETIRTPILTADQAVLAAAAALRLPEPDALALLASDPARADQAARFRSEGFAEETIPTRLVYYRLPESDAIRLAWELSIKPVGVSDWWQAWIDARDGALLGRVNWTSDSDTYRVFPAFAESPDNVSGVRTDEVDPWMDGGSSPTTGASPFGWHDTNGVINTPEFTDTRGNNVQAQTDLDANNTFTVGTDVRGDGGAGPSLLFQPAIDLALGPDTYREAAVVNLFYWNNIMHDVSYQYGFNEVSGNFQTNNYGRGGSGNDAVQADAQDGSGTDNANFSTPSDGLQPRMQMFVWSAPQDIHETTPTDRHFPAGAMGAGWGASPTFTVPANLWFVNDGVGTGDAQNDGCETTGPSWNVSGKIALVRRGGCEFGLKALNAQNQGAVGTIIINNGSNGVAGMGGGVSGPSVTTPAQMIGKANGNLLVAELAGNTVTVGITMSSTASLPNRDSDLDAGIIAHEYGHGISNRLTGGPANSGCLGNQEQMGEGWSDFQTLFLHAEPGDTATTERSVGGYATFEPFNTAGYIGIRRFPYTTDNAVNTDTYATVATFPLNTTGNPIPVHNIGSVWAEMLWEVYWNILGIDSFDADVYGGTGGNNVMYRLVLDGMKLQPCSPGFVDGRNGILAADAADFDGDHECAIWAGFAERGLGSNASQGSSGSYTDGTAGTNLPTQCQNYIFSSSFGHADFSHWSLTTP